MLPVHLAVGHHRHQVPLFRGVVQSDGTTLYGTHAVMNDFNAGILLVVETSVKTVAEYQHVDCPTFEIVEVVERQVLC